MAGVVGGEGSVQGCAGNTQARGDRPLRRTHRTLAECLVELGRRELRRPPVVVGRALPGGCDACMDAGNGALALHLGHPGEDGNHEAPDLGRGVEALPQAAERRLGFLYLVDGVQQVAGTAAEAVNGPHGEAVAWLELGKNLAKGRAVRPGTRPSLRNHLVTTSATKGVELELWILVRCGDPGVAVGAHAGALGASVSRRHSRHMYPVEERAGIAWTAR